MSETQRQFGHDSTTTEVLEGIDLTGKTALVTGASGGLGAETARALASKGARVLITARNAEKGAGVVESIRAACPTGGIEIDSLELDSLASVRAFAERYLARNQALDILVNNAGVMACPFEKTRDGFEMQFGTNHIGHFLLTCLLVPALRQAKSARVVCVSSRGHQMSPVVFDDIHFERRPYDKWDSYGQSKTANVLFAVELDRRLGSSGVHANALHPGVIFTDLARHLQSEDMERLRKRNPGGKMRFKTVEAGAATSVFAATAPELEGRGGLYLEDCHVAALNDAENATDGVRSYALAPDNARRLWEVSERLVAQTFPW